MRVTFLLCISLAMCFYTETTAIFLKESDGMFWGSSSDLSNSAECSGVSRNHVLVVSSNDDASAFKDLIFSSKASFVTHDATKIPFLMMNSADGTLDHDQHYHDSPATATIRDVSSLNIFLGSLSEEKGAQLQSQQGQSPTIHHVRLDVGSQKEEDFKHKAGANMLLSSFIEKVTRRLSCTSFVFVAGSNTEQASNDNLKNENDGILYEGTIMRHLQTHVSNEHNEVFLHSLYHGGTNLYITPDIMVGLFVCFAFVVIVLVGLGCTNDIQGAASFTDEKSIPPVGKEA